MGRQYRALPEWKVKAYKKDAASLWAAYKRQSAAYKQTPNYAKHQANMKVYRARKRRFNRMAKGLPVRSKKKKTVSKKKKKKVTRKKKKSAKKKSRKKTKSK